MADAEGSIEIDPKDLEGEYKPRRAEFKPTNELQWIKPYKFVNPDLQVLQQKWANELGDGEWRDIPLVISD